MRSVFTLAVSATLGVVCQFLPASNVPLILLKAALPPLFLLCIDFRKLALKADELALHVQQVPRPKLVEFPKHGQLGVAGQARVSSFPLTLVSARDSSTDSYSLS
jgi:hypothetical protein